MSYSESDWLRATKTHTFYILRCFYLPHSDNIQHDSLCPWILLEWFHQTPGKKQKKPKQTTEGNITRKCSTLSFCSTSQFDKSFKRSIRSPGTSMQATSWMICNSSASQLWSSSAWQSSWRVLRHDCHWLLQYQSSFIPCCECTQFISPSRQTITQMSPHIVLTSLKLELCVWVLRIYNQSRSYWMTVHV